MAIVAFNAMPVSAAEPTINEEAGVLEENHYSTEVPSAITENSIPLPINEILSHSAVSTRGATMEGSYKSGSYSAGLAGYAFSISFDWKATVNSSGDYIFSSIDNAMITTHKDTLFCNMTWAYSSYKITKNEYVISSDKKSVVFNTSYDFEYVMKEDPISRFYTHSEAHSNRIVLDNII